MNPSCSTNKRLLSPRLLCAFFIIGALLLLLAIIMNNEKSGAFIERNVSFQNGDLIFIRGRTWRSWLVRYIDDIDDYSHVGIVRFVNGVPNVIHAAPEAEAVQLESIGDFLSQSNNDEVGIYRLISNQSIADKASLEAWNYFVSGTSFDHKFDIMGDEELYCTELIWRAYKNVGVDLSEGESDFLYDSNIYGMVLLPKRLSMCRRLAKIVEDGI